MDDRSNLSVRLCLLSFLLGTLAAVVVGTGFPRFPLALLGQIGKVRLECCYRRQPAIALTRLLAAH